MKFLMMLAEPTHDTEPPADFGTRARAWSDKHDATGTRVSGAKLRPSFEARTTRVRNGRRSLTPEPFTTGAEEVLRGFDILECDSLEEAVRIAGEHPLVEFGAIEVRPFWDDWHPKQY